MADRRKVHGRHKTGNPKITDCGRGFWDTKVSTLTDTEDPEVKEMHRPGRASVLVSDNRDRVTCHTCRWA